MELSGTDRTWFAHAPSIPGSTCRNHPRKTAEGRFPSAFIYRDEVRRKSPARVISASSTGNPRTVSPPWSQVVHQGHTGERVRAALRTEEHDTVLESLHRTVSGDGRFDRSERGPEKSCGPAQFGELHPDGGLSQSQQLTDQFARPGVVRGARRSRQPRDERYRGSDRAGAHTRRWRDDRRRIHLSLHGEERRLQLQSGANLLRRNVDGCLRCR